MKSLGKHLGFLRHLGEFQFKRWLDNNAHEFLVEVGLRQGQVALDFGCGSGTYTIPAAEIVGESGLVYALDVSSSALDKLENKANKMGIKNIVRIDSSGSVNIPIKDETLNHILMIDVLQEIEDKDKLFNEAFRTLNPEGTITIYPMHIEEKKIIKIASDKSLILKDKKYDDHILIFKKRSHSKI